MYDPPAYVWTLTIAGPTAIAAATCVVLYGGAVRAGLSRRRATLLAGAAAALLGGIFVATAVTAGQGWYDTRPGQFPWLPVAALAFLGTLLLLGRIPVVARALTAPGMASRLVLPHTFRVTGVFFLIYLALGHLPALFALPAGLGDIAAGIAAPLAARRLSRGTSRRAGVWFNVYGLTDITTSVTIGALTGYGLLHITPSTAPIGQLPLALVIVADVPLMIALHITSLIALSRASRPVAPATASSGRPRTRRWRSARGSWSPAPGRPGGPSASKMARHSASSSPAATTVRVPMAEPRAIAIRVIGNRADMVVAGVPSWRTRIPP